ncbi:MAG: UDP-N-acetylmuramate dehydrogenase [Coriobacteriia bacterium]|nr:UDP-N-acetylmuramate dehydrogenase [Coriobacteriia bacterium]
MSLAGATERLQASLSGEIRTGEPMARHTTFRLGGAAAVLCVLDSMHDVTAAMSIVSDEDVPWTIIGKGSNLLVADRGYDGVVFVLGREFKRHVVDGETIRAGAACVLAHLVQDAFKRGLAGLTWGVGIPGTLGGALAMNAGTHEGWIGQFVDTVTIFEPGSGLRLVRGTDVAWEYRRSGLMGRGLILEASLRVVPGDPVRIRAEMERNLTARKAAQPLGLPSAGSVFVNPAGDSAGRLIDAAGLKGANSGAARISPVHANFIVNEGGATAADVVALIRRVQTTVKDEFGVDLRPEIRFLGTFEEA